MTDPLDELLEGLQTVADQKNYRKMDFYKPYPKQKLFHDLGKTHRERALIAANQTGKTFCAGMEVAYHLTGEYPEWWDGKRFDGPTRGWVAGETGLATRKNPQRILLGDPYPEMIGTGTIPKDRIVGSPSLARGVSDAVDTVIVQHKSGGLSTVQMMSYEMGRSKWQGDTLHFIWNDEEPPMDVYSEGLTRLSVLGGIDMNTFTPLQGMTEVVDRFVKQQSPDRAYINMTLDDAEHFTPERREQMIAGWPEYEREARSKGAPMLGSGRIFQVLESEISVQPFPIPETWWLWWGIDPGVGHPFGAVLMAWNKDTDVMYVVHCIKMKGALPLAHAEAMKHVLNGAGKIAPVAWPQDAYQRREFDGQLAPLAQIYKKHGLNMYRKHATFEDGSNSTEAGIIVMDERLRSSRLKVFSHCAEWFEEYRLYHRKDGEIVKQNDDLMSSTRVALMAKRIGRAVLYVPERGAGPAMAKDIDIPLFD